MAQPLKDMINAASVAALADGVAAARAGFARDRFVADALAGLDGKELKARVNHVAQTLHTTLDLPFPQAARVLREATAHVRLDMWSGWPATDYVAVHGIDHLDEAMATLAVITPFATAEFAVRPQLDRHRDAALAIMRDWADSDDEHLRRLASEGTRARLPWGSRVTWLMAPGPTLPILERLRDDPSEYVRRSVANHVNDLAKDHPEAALALLRRWHTGGGEHTARVVRHAARGLLRAGHPEALGLVGAAHGSGTVEALTIADTVTIGDRIPFGVTVRAEQSGPLLLKYAIARNGSRRVFHLAERVAEAPGDIFTLARSHSFRPVTTRAEPPGPRHIEIIVNGEVRATAPFTVLA
ncbi:DNA alkylation repair protein [Embleya sp. AB8]|uniref:DNA alkylation repair protein n=1 Tax=Embleya sp. AB8 TaxID=3156304 RepID=UPI003C729C46